MGHQLRPPHVSQGVVYETVPAHDPALGADTMRATWLQQLPGSTLDVMTNAGHYAMFETPVALMTSIEKTLSALR